MRLKVGELSKRTGLTVRTLHHYDEIGLLKPSHRSEAGYRMYTRDDLTRLHRIQALKQLGLGLAEIGETLAADGETLEELIDKQLAALSRQLEKAERLRRQLLSLKEKMSQGEKPGVADLLTTLELMTMYEKYFTPEELQTLEKHRANAGPDLDARWAQIVATMRRLMESGADPACEEACKAVDEWQAAAALRTGNDLNLQVKLGEMIRNEPAAREKTGIDAPLMAYVMRCIRARAAALYAKYLTPAELEQVMQGREKTGAHWPPLVAAMRVQFEQGAEVSAPAVRELALKWKALLDISHGADETLRHKLRDAYAQEPALLQGTGLDLPLLDYARQALRAL